MSKIIYFSYLDCDKEEVLKLEEGLKAKGYEIKDQLAEGVTKIRVSILRSDVIVMVSSEKSLVLDNYYVNNTLIKRFNKDKKVINVLLNSSIDNLFDLI